MSIEDRITTYISTYVKGVQRDKLSGVTMRMIKEHLASSFEGTNDDWSDVQMQNKDFIKETSHLLLNERLDEGSMEMSAKELDTVPKKRGHVDNEGRKDSSNKENNTASASASDDFTGYKVETKNKKLKGTPEAGSSEEDFQPAKGRDGKPRSKERGDGIKIHNNRNNKKNKQSKIKPVEPSDSSDDSDFQAKSKPMKHTSDKTSDKEKKHDSREKKNTRIEVVKKAYSAEVTRLKDIARQAALNVPPAVYTGHPESSELEHRLTKFLLSHGFKNVHPNRSDISKVKNELKLQRELEGIDTTNIVHGRRGEPKDNSPAIKFRVKAVSSSDSE